MVKRVSCGAVVNGVQLTILKEMARCEKSDLTRSRAVPTNSGQRVEKVLTVKDIKAVKKLVLKRIDEDNDGTFIGRQGGSVLWCTACRSPVDHSKDHVNEHISTKKQLEALKSIADRVQSTALIHPGIFSTHTCKGRNYRSEDTRVSL